MGSFFRFTQIEFGTSDHHFHPEFDELRDQVFQVHHPWPSFTDGHIIDTVGGL